MSRLGSGLGDFADWAKRKLKKTNFLTLQSNQTTTANTDSDNNTAATATTAIINSTDNPDHSIIFTVQRLNRSGIPQHRQLILSASIESITFTDPLEFDTTTNNNNSYTVSIHSISVLEKCNTINDRNRCIIYYTPTDSYRPLTLIFTDEATRNAFIELLASINRVIELRTVSTVAGGGWISDNESSCCMRCKTEFTIIFRRHHCRSCGRIVCNNCSPHNASLPSIGFSRPVRICNDCFSTIRDMRILDLTKSSSAPTANNNNNNNSNGNTNTANNNNNNSDLLTLNPINPSLTIGGNGRPSQDLQQQQQLLTTDEQSNLETVNQIKRDFISIPSRKLNIRSSIITTTNSNNTVSASTTASTQAASTGPSTTTSGFSTPARSNTPGADQMSPESTNNNNNNDNNNNSIITSPAPSTAVNRDMYGFIVGAESDRSGLNSYYESELSKQRLRWNQYLVLNPVIDKQSKSMKKLVRRGIPPELRGQMWQILSGSRDRQLSAPIGYYKQLVIQAESIGGIAATEIEKDLHRTFPDNALYESQAGLGMLRRVLLAYSYHNPKVRYCQSLNFIAALNLLFMEEEEAFWLLLTIVEDITAIPADDNYPSTADPLADAIGSILFYHQSDLAGAHVDQSVLADLIAEKLPKISAHLDKLQMPLAPLAMGWFLCLFVNTLPLETTLQCWDCLFAEGAKMNFRTALALLKVNEKAILKCVDFEECMAVVKLFSVAAADTGNFMKVCFDPLVVGSFPMSRITELRLVHRNRIELDLQDRRIKSEERKNARNKSNNNKYQPQSSQTSGSVSALITTPTSAASIISPVAAIVSRASDAVIAAIKPINTNQSESESPELVSLTEPEDTFDINATRHPPASIANAPPSAAAGFIRSPRVGSISQSVVSRVHSWSLRAALHLTDEQKKQAIIAGKPADNDTETDTDRAGIAVTDSITSPSDSIDDHSDSINSSITAPITIGPASTRSIDVKAAARKFESINSPINAAFSLDPKYSERIGLFNLIGQGMQNNYFNPQTAVTATATAATTNSNNKSAVNSPPVAEEDFVRIEQSSVSPHNNTNTTTNTNNSNSNSIRPFRLTIIKPNNTPTPPPATTADSTDSNNTIDTDPSDPIVSPTTTGRSSTIATGPRLTHRLYKSLTSRSPNTKSNSIIDNNNTNNNNPSNNNNNK